jgi:hypothetical protein
MFINIDTKSMVGPYLVGDKQLYNPNCLYCLKADSILLSKVMKSCNINCYMQEDSLNI